MGRGQTVAPLGQPPEGDRFQECGHSTDQEHEIDQDPDKRMTPAQGANERAVQSAPIHHQENGRHERQRIGGGGVIEQARDIFQRRQRGLQPDVGQAWPLPRGKGNNLGQIEIGHGLRRTESQELKNRIGKTEHDEGDPHALEPANAAEAIAQSLVHGIKKHDEQVAATKTEQRIHSRQT